MGSPFFSCLQCIWNSSMTKCHTDLGPGGMSIAERKYHEPYATASQPYPGGWLGSGCPPPPFPAFPAGTEIKNFVCELPQWVRGGSRPLPRDISPGPAADSPCCVSQCRPATSTSAPRRTPQWWPTVRGRRRRPRLGGVAHWRLGDTLCHFFFHGNRCHGTLF